MTWKFIEEITVSPSQRTVVKFRQKLSVTHIQFLLRPNLNYIGKCGWVELETDYGSQLLYRAVFYQKAHIIYCDEEFGAFFVKFFPIGNFRGGKATIHYWDAPQLYVPTDEDFEDYGFPLT